MDLHEGMPGTLSASACHTLSLVLSLRPGSAVEHAPRSTWYRKEQDVRSPGACTVCLVFSALLSSKRKTSKAVPAGSVLIFVMIRITQTNLHYSTLLVNHLGVTHPVTNLLSEARRLALVF